MKIALSAKPLLLICAGSWAIMLAGCEKEATGQVAAVVNGEEITLQEINAMLAEANIPSGADNKAIQQQALQQIVDKRLLAQVAREDGIDQDPVYLIKQRQLNEALLIQMYGQKTGSTLKVPDKSAIDNYVKTHPFSFANRKIYNVDQISFPVPADISSLKSLEKANTLPEVAAILDSMKIKYQRGTTQMDSAQVPAAMMAQIASLAPGEPFVVPSAAVVTANVITGSQSVPIDESQMASQIVDSIRKEELSEILKKRLEAAKSKAEITYQDGFSAADSTAKGAKPKLPAKTPAT